jgi:hypothetical protein
MIFAFVEHQLHFAGTEPGGSAYEFASSGGIFTRVRTCGGISVSYLGHKADIS